MATTTTKLEDIKENADIDRDEPDQADLFDAMEALEERPPGPSFSVDDVIEFHYLLEDDRYIRDFLASSGDVA